MSFFDLSPWQIKRLSDALHWGYDDIIEEAGGGLREKDLARIDERRRRYIREMESPYELHLFVEGYNWDDGDSALSEVVRHPFCDQGTASMIYWLNVGIFAEDYSSDDHFKADYELQIEIETRMLTRGFESKAIRYHPLIDWLDPSMIDRFFRQPLPIMRLPTPGETPPPFETDQLYPPGGD